MSSEANSGSWRYAKNFFSEASEMSWLVEVWNTMYAINMYHNPLSVIRNGKGPTIFDIFSRKENRQTNKRNRRAFLAPPPSAQPPKWKCGVEGVDLHGQSPNSASPPLPVHNPCFFFLPASLLPSIAPFLSASSVQRLRILDVNIYKNCAFRLRCSKKPIHTYPSNADR